MRAILYLCLTAAWAQTPKPAFEVASVKVAPPMSPEMGMMVEISDDPGMVEYKNVNLRMLLINAFGVKDYQVSGPDWLNSDRYIITAKTPSNTTRAQVHLMLQSLLADRFKLQFHNEKKELPVYALLVAKNGPKLKPSTTSEDDSSMRMGRGTMQAQGMSLSQLSNALSRLIARPVLDMTEQTGRYDFGLEFAPDPGMGNAMVKMAAEAARTGDAPDVMSRPSIFTALQEQLGLKLDARKAPIDIMVIDHAQRIPTEN